MVRVNFSAIEDISNFSPVPEGEYLAQVVEVEEGATQYGVEMWKLRLLIVDGEYRGRYVFDNMVFSDAALKRVKHICSALGLPDNLDADLTPEMIEGRKCFVDVEAGEYQDKQGNTKQKNVIPFAGYSPAQPTEEAKQEEDCPF